ncbi:[FeFe] hydrogenase, group A [[Clostridium] polysaccharolyticum]|uniref:NADH-quinone oxidoreductase subunit G n=1 Tax=[Clostridium] polysaccharolyticum TaxID=29364 RepID=A0A1I0FPF8_9FIRM|nr:[FeFe] hydrogenase, group A [[Clostridium] polysaccharolyticum]SET60238.1 NADH-quinone oxidoreductase subunit G [[Clostridium] polysaccharolyticum]
MSKYMIIDGNRVDFDSEKNILQVVKKAGIHLPTFCYYSDLSIYGACRMCVVEDQWGGIIASCSTPPKDKMIIKTNTPKLHQHRKMILELLLASHCGDCKVCEKNGSCRLQLLAGRFGLKEIRFKQEEPKHEIDKSSKSIVRNPNKCILCGDCVRVCNEVQNVGAIGFANRGAKMVVSPAFNKNLAETDCVNCGQCAAVCPTAAITITKSTKEVWKAIYDPTKRVVVQVAPAVRVAIGEAFGLNPGKNTMGKIFKAMRMLGFDQVFDTSVGADLTIMEEVAELGKKLESGDTKYPLFTSCCPAWIRYAETKHPELLSYISSCKSPMEMFGAVLKEYYKPADKEEEKETVSVAVMPCAAKKSEAAREEFIRNGIPDVDYVITTNELIHMIKEEGIQFTKIEPEAPDMPFSIASGSGVIFGATGGVTEAALRKVVSDKTNKSLQEIEYSGIRGFEGIKTADISLGDKTVRIAVVSGLGNAEEIIRRIQSGEDHFDFVEVMACPGGCIAGAGQPFSHKPEKLDRTAGLYKADKTSVIKRSEENPVITQLYQNDCLKGREHELLHVHYQRKE